MTKQRVTKQSIRRSSKRQEEQQRRQQQTRRNRIIAVVAVVLVMGVLAFGLLRQTPSSDGDRPLAGVDPRARNQYYDEYPDMLIDTSKTYEAVIRTEKGDMRFRLFDDESPLAVNNFVFLANQGFYDNTIFHRVLQDFMAQAGDPTGLGTGGPGYLFEDETDNGLRFDRPGLLAMANAGPNTNGSQFFITFVPTPHLDGAHTIFGELTAGEEVLNSITFVEPGSASTSAPQGDLIERIDINELTESGS